MICPHYPPLVQLEPRHKALGMERQRPSQGLDGKCGDTGYETLGTLPMRLPSTASTFILEK